LRATRAYITGFGTTGLLIAAAFMTLFVMSAYVAFNGFPGQDVGDPIGTLVVPQQQTRVNVPAVPVQVHAQAATRAPAGQRRSATARRAIRPRATTGPVKHRSTTQAPSVAPAPATTPATGASPVPASTPQLPATPPQVPTSVLPKVSLPVIQAPSQTQTPAVDTGGVTDLANGL
jgi:hypothetical protein